jgi:N-acyl-D-aspartate/D-glutamate deacylase
MAYDLLIRNGRVIDGSGMPSFHGDVAVKDGRIVEMGKLGGPARRTINAEGLAVAPGFIDNHCHYDAQVTWDPLCTFSCHHGATTVIIGNCSLALAPARAQDHAVLNQMLARVEAIPLEVLETGLRWSWESIPEYLNAIDRRLGVNVGVLIGHSPVRRYVMGDGSQERARATGEELDAMKAIVREGMEAGALGISFNRNPGHFDMRGKLLPSCLAPQEELFALAEVLGEVGTGVIQSGASAPFELRDRLCSRLSQISGRPVIYNQIVYRTNAPDQWREHLAFLEQAVQQGLRSYPLVNPRHISSRFTMKNAQVFDRMPAWSPIMTGPLEGKVKAFRDPEARKRLRAEAVDGSGVPYENFSRRWDLMLIAKPALEKNARLKGKSVVQVAQEQGKEVLDAFLDLVLEENLETTFEFSQLGGNDEAMATLLASPYTVVGLSDGGAHLIFDAGYGFSTLFLGHWVREKQVMSLEEAVRKLTFHQASLFGLHDRGLLRPGLAADLVLFDPDIVAPLEQQEVRDLPGGAPRLQQLAQGIEYTVVNGQVLMEHGEHAGAYPGRVLRNPLARARATA